MKATSPILLAKEKIKRAALQIGELHRDIRAFMRSAPYRIQSHVNVTGTEEIWKFELEADVPMEFSARAGEILHNLRSALDHAVCAVAEKHSGSFKGIYFPFGASEEIFLRQLESKTKKLPEEAKAIIRDLQPYKGGNEVLWRLHALNRADKHTPVLTAGLQKSWKVREIKVTSGEILIIGSRYGQHLVRNGYKPQFNVLEDINDGMEFMTTTPGTIFHGDFYPSFSLCFRDNTGLGNKTVAVALEEMRKQVDKIVEEFEGVFSNST